jgi:hypothetical protein
MMNVSHWGSAYLNAFLGQSLGQLRRAMRLLGDAS